MSGVEPRARIDCLLLSAGDYCWLAPAVLVAEVIAHFGDHAPASLAWREEQLPCVDATGGKVRALAVLRRVHGDGGGFYAIALREPPRPLQVLPGMLEGAARGDFEVDGRRVRVFDAAGLEASLPTV